MNNNQKNVVYLIKSPLSVRDYARFGIDAWIDRGWTVRIFDLSKILNKKYLDYMAGNEDAWTPSKGVVDLSVFKSSREALRKIECIESRCIFIDFLNQGFFQRKVRKMAKRQGIILELHLGSIPIAIGKPSLIQKLHGLILRPNRLFQYIVNKIFYVSKIEPDYIVVGGAKSEGFTRSKIIRAHNFDYDFFLKDENLDEISNSYVLFLDENICFHPDDYFLNLPQCATPECYFPTMNKGLRAIAKVFDSEIIIAAHPSSNYEKRPKLFEYPTIKNHTYELIKNAKLVIAHGSTSVQIAILLRKPILLVTTDQLEKSYCANSYRGFRRELRKPTINLDNIVESSAILAGSSIDDLIYDQYIHNYIKQAHTPIKGAWEVVIDKLEADLRAV
ncbi:hypothetical protein AB8879_10545 [Alphaproteobacteria bacterium LSUCC0744]